MKGRVDRKGGGAPPVPYRSVREPLDSYGSCRPSSGDFSVSGLPRKEKFLPVTRLTHTHDGLTHPLRSSPITGPSSLLQDDPPPSCASILSPFVVLTYRVFSYHHRKGSHVPRKGLNQGHATFMPDAARPVSRLLPCLSRDQHRTPVLTSTLLFRHLISGLLALISLIHTCHSLMP